jgi:protocatechuate 3,4-dioxygenase beta subunit
LIDNKVFAPYGRELLTTQLYFPGSNNPPDVQVTPDLLVASQGVDDQGRRLVFFNFVVQTQP